MGHGDLDAVNVTTETVAQALRHASGAVYYDYGSTSHSRITSWQKRTVDHGRKLPVPQRNPEGPYLKSYFKSTLSGAIAVHWAYDISNVAEGDLYGVGMGPFYLDLAYPIHRPLESGLRHSEIDDRGSTPLNPDLLSQAEVKCLNKLRDKMGDTTVDFGLWWGERRETARLFQQGCDAIADLAKAIARKDFRRSANVLKDMFGVKATPHGERRRQQRVERYLRNELNKAPDKALLTVRSIEDALLGYKLGLSPLMKDLDEALTRLQMAPDPNVLWIKATARHSRFKEGQDVYSPPEGVMTVEAKEQHGYTVTLICAPRYDEMATLSRLGLTNPANTAYQLTGRSFLVDYWLNLGSWLQSLNAGMEFEFIDGSYTQRIIRTSVMTIKSAQGKVAKGVMSFNHTKRTVYNEMPVPIPPLSLKGKDLSVSQAVTAGLLASKFLQALYRQVK